MKQEDERLTQKMWKDWKTNLKLLCRKCKKPAGLHGAFDGYCPKDKGTYFMPYQNLKTK